MSIDELLARLDRPRKMSRGWIARCPAHQDRSPSLSVREGDGCVLLKCWAGCPVEKICAAIGLRVKDLFYDDRPDPHRIQKAQERRERKAAKDRAELKRPAVFLEAEAVIQTATGVDISAWSHEQLDAAMDAVCDAREILIKEEDDGQGRYAA